MLCLAALVGAGTTLAAAATEQADDFLIVDCLLPAQIRQLGLNHTFLAPRQAIRTSANECAIRGGEFNRGDAGGPAGLKMWLPQAEQGDASAQTYVGEIFERGLAGQPDYAAAVVWYQRAAAQGNARAEIALGSLIEQGLGAPKDPIAAAKLFRRAAGLPEDMPGLEANDGRVKELSSKLAAVTAADSAKQLQLDQQSAQLRKLRQQLDQRQGAAQRERDKLAALQRELDASRKRADSGTAPAAQQQQQLQQTLTAREQELDRTRARVDQLNAKLAAADTQRSAADAAQIDQLRHDLDGARAAASAKQSEADTLRRELAQTQQANAARDATAQKQADALAARERDLADSQAQADKLRDRLAALEAQRQTQQTQQSTSDAELDKLRQDLDAARASVAAKQGEADTLRQHLQQTQQANDARDQIAKAQAQTLAAREHDLADSQAQADKLRDQLASLESASQAQQAKQSASDAALDKMRHDLDQARQSLAAQQNDADRLRAELKSAQENGAAREQGLESKVDQLQREIKDRQDRIAARDAEIAGLKQQMAGLETTRSVNPKADGAAGAAQPVGFSIADFGHYHALVIGIDNYQKLPPLHTPIADANEVARVLKQDYGFDVTLLLDANRYQILSRLNHLRQTLTDKDNLLIYYAGHGELDQVNQRGNWLPVDAEADNTTNWISNVQITDILNAMAARQILVVADSCYSGTLTRSVASTIERAQGESERLKWYKVMISKPSRVALTSGGLEPVADSGGGGHSAFAALFIKTLETNAGVLSAQEVYSHIEPAVATTGDNTHEVQVPEYAPIKMAGHEAGDFLFVRNNTANP